MELSRREAIRISAITALGIGSTLTAKASTAYDIDVGVAATLDRFYGRSPWSRSFAQRSAGMLIFPTIVKAGFGFGGEYGEGSLLTPRHPAEYYNTVSASFGFQLGAQARSVIIMFMTPDALEGFRMKDGWKVGVDGSVAIIAVGAGGAVDTNTIHSPIVGFIFDQRGLMYNLTLEGSKISRIYR
jgi:lipid-binding SYLF domain-containing protein